MGRFIVRRFLWMLVVLLFLSFITFALENAVPGGPFDREKKLPAVTVEMLNEKYGLDKTFFEQYGLFLYNVAVPRIFHIGPFSFQIGPEFAGELDRKEISPALREQFQGNGRPLSEAARVEVKKAGNQWTIVDDDTRYTIRSEDQALRVSGQDPDPSNSVMERYLVAIPLGGGWHFRWINLGPSLQLKERSVAEIIQQNLPVSFQLGLLALTIAIIIGMPMGILAALKQNTIWDYLGMSVAIFGVSVPVIAMGPILQYIFGVLLKWLPPTGWGATPPFVAIFFPRDYTWDGFWKFAIMPAFALGIGNSAIIARLTRASLLQVIREDYIRTARAKGLSERVVIMRHALRNSLIPVVTILGPMFAAVVTGTFVTEQIFGIPGLGRYFITSITNRDYTVIMGTILLYAVFLILANLMVDITYAWLDPRIRYE